MFLVAAVVHDCSGDDEQKHSSRHEDSVKENQDASTDNVDGEGGGADPDFGWRLCYDGKRNLAFYLHGYTGEVRWIHPETIGFVMEGNKPLPVGAVDEGAVASTPVTVDPARASQGGCMNWSPYHPQVVMMPSGLMEVCPGVYSRAPMLRGYNRFPVAWNFGPGVIARSGVEVEALQNTLKQSPGRRILPPTWETSVRERSPFLSPYPVAILGGQPTSPRSCKRGDKDAKQIASTNKEGHYSTAPQVQHEANAHPVGTQRLQPQMTFAHPPPLPPFPVPPYQRFTEHTHFQPVDVLTKEHNRKGYMLRQNRKLSKEQGQGKSSQTSQKTTPRCAQPNEQSRAMTKHYMQPNRVTLREQPFRGKR